MGLDTIPVRTDTIALSGIVPLQQGEERPGCIILSLGSTVALAMATVDQPKG